MAPNYPPASFNGSRYADTTGITPYQFGTGTQFYSGNVAGTYIVEYPVTHAAPMWTEQTYRSAEAKRVAIRMQERGDLLKVVVKKNMARWLN